MKEKMKSKKRFIAKKRTALDGKVWWCVWDIERRGWSTFVCHGVYTTKQAAENDIAYNNRKLGKYLK